MTEKKHDLIFLTQLKEESVMIYEQNKIEEASVTVQIQKEVISDLKREKTVFVKRDEGVYMIDL